MLGHDLDSRLIALLQQDARLSTAELARRLGVARSTVQGRVERLERAGVIQGYTLRLGAPHAGAAVKAHVAIGVAPKHQAAVERQLMRLPGIETLYSISGDHDLIAIVAVEDTAALDRCLDAIRATDGVISTNSAIILTTRMSRRQA